jgi:hypothetical protein
MSILGPTSPCPSAIALRRLAVAAVLASVGAVAACGAGANPVFGDGDGGEGTPGGTTTTDGGGKGGAGGGVGTGGVGGGSETSSSTGSNEPGIPCASDADCTVGAMTLCDPSTLVCVECVAGGVEDHCMKGELCTAEGKCEVGCDAETDCDAPLTCDPVKKKCTGCSQDSDCPAGSVCSGDTCVAGCSDEQGCPVGKQCCTGQCSDSATDPANCGGCGLTCAGGANGVAACTGGVCGLACLGVFADCNGDLADGCERNTLQDGACACVPNATESCYGGPPGTEGLGECKAGTRTCSADGSKWGPCEGQVLPVAETVACGNGKDDDCNSIIDDVADLDGDGWTKCDGDCCDSVSDGCSEPTLVNPGAFDVSGNNLDDDCNGVVDDGATTCDANLASNSGNALDYAKAIDLCAETTENPPPGDKRWGVISAGLFLANGAGSPNANSRSIRSGFGTNVSPKKGSKLAVISSGYAAAKSAPNNTNPSYQTFQIGADMGTSSAVPADWLQANGGKIPSAPGCNISSSTTANDPVMLKVRVRAPTNAKSFNVSSFFYSAEYPEYVCTAYNDFFLTLLDSAFVPGPGETANPADKNLAFYDAGGGKHYPVGVNLANTGLFKSCKNGQISCAGSTQNYTGCTSTNELAGTGFDDSFGGCGSNNLLGGGTGWLTTSGNVKPGETIELRFVIWDTQDHIYDSVSLLDNFEWSLSAAQPGTHD